MTKKITLRLIAFLMSILMSLSLIPAGILAAENNETIAADSTSNTTTIEDSSEQLDPSNEVLDVQTVETSSTTSTPASRASRTIKYPEGIVFNIVTYLTVRDKPSATNFKEIGKLYNGDVVSIIGVDSGFFKVITTQGQEGFVTALYVKLKYPLARVINVSTYLTLRDKPDSEGIEELDQIPNGALIQLTGEVSGKYSEAVYNGKIGWVTTQYTQKISLTGANSGGNSKPLYSSGTGSGTGADYGPLTGKTTAGMAKYGIVRVNHTLNVRSGPSLSAPIIGSLKANDIVTIMSDDNGWMAISWSWSGGDVAYCSADYVKYGKWVYLSYAQTDSRTTATWKSIHNMQLAASKLHYHIVKPGEEFSWKETIGAATYDKGYIDAGIIINNGFSEGPGGGVCQVSTTINWAAMIAGFDTDRVAHAFPRPYVPDVKYEATVAIPYGVNFSFTNTRSAPIRFVFDTDGSSCLCEIQIFYYTP